MWWFIKGFFLGVHQVDVIGQKVQDIVHPQDCSELLRIFQSQGQDSEQGQRSMPPRTILTDQHPLMKRKLL